MTKSGIFIALAALSTLTSAVDPRLIRREFSSDGAVDLVEREPQWGFLARLIEKPIVKGITKATQHAAKNSVSSSQSSQNPPPNGKKSRELAAEDEAEVLERELEEYLSERYLGDDDDFYLD